LVLVDLVFCRSIFLGGEVLMLEVISHRFVLLRSVAGLISRHRLHFSVGLGFSAATGLIFPVHVQASCSEDLALVQCKGFPMQVMPATCLLAYGVHPSSFPVEPSLGPVSQLRPFHFAARIFGPRSDFSVCCAKCAEILFGPDSSSRLKFTST
jgi:hypothetical protein